MKRQLFEIEQIITAKHARIATSFEYVWRKLAQGHVALPPPPPPPPVLSIVSSFGSLQTNMR